ncbi:hypothetical protein KHF85_11755 [Xanthomonas translucens pv. graminis]|uniref:hypothetical protein n=1 Tax=Xanthomonas graminis TaxID=3390026 RepID=UPI002540D71C|nr:hypothetical protein [Xanthomonas translucens]WIH03585.1 hypothetical protein KHF85_11755 [Xanthomonas translucens pv. graminis]
MSDNEQIQGDHDTSLLEGLFQLVVDGQTQGWEFEQLSNEVYDRLKETYEHAAIGSAKVQLRGSMAG